jgi:hypothetical protein
MLIRESYIFLYMRIWYTYPDEERPFASRRKGVFYFICGMRGGGKLDFEWLYASFIANHAALRSGERKGRLLRGHAYAEKLFLQQVWAPLFGNFDNLHPEYEISHTSHLLASSVSNVMAFRAMSRIWIAISSAMR